MQILYDIENGSIIVPTQTAWDTPGEYCLPGYAVIDAPCPEGFCITSVKHLGDPEDFDVSNWPGYIESFGIGKVYRNAELQIDPISEGYN